MTSKKIQDTRSKHQEPSSKFQQNDLQSSVEGITSAIQTVVASLVNEEVEVTLERPARSEHGDWSCAVALKLAKPLKRNPVQIAQEIADALPALEGVAKVEVLPPGFINFHFSEEHHFRQLASITETYGTSSLGKGKKVMVEFGQPNTHKAVTVGHLKSAISGLATARLHENLGYEVIQANYFGDVGMHVAQATWGFLQKGQPEQWDTLSLTDKMNYTADCYVYAAKAFKEDPAAEQAIRTINKAIYAKKPGIEYDTYKLLREISVASQDAFFAQLGVHYDRQYPESEVYEEAITIVDSYKNKLFEQSEGAWIYDGKKEGLTTWVFETKEGNPTYSAKDMALGAMKFREYPDLFKSIIHTSVEQADYFKVVIRVLEQIVPETKGKYLHFPFGWLLFSNRKLSSRTGGVPKATAVIDDVITVAKEKIGSMRDYTPQEQDEIAYKVAMGGLKFVILSHEFTSSINYNPEQFMSLLGFSGPFLMYSYARSQSIARKAKYIHSQPEPSSLSGLTDPREQTLIKILAQYPEVAERAALTVQPHLVATYLFEVAQTYNQWYSEVPISTEKNVKTRQARLFLNWASGIVLKNGLHLLGIETLEKM